MTCHICAKQNCIGECEPKIAKPAREWMGLTDDELLDTLLSGATQRDGLRAIEAKLREKNT